MQVSILTYMHMTYLEIKFSYLNNFKSYLFSTFFKSTSTIITNYELNFKNQAVYYYFRINDFRLVFTILLL